MYDICYYLPINMFKTVLMSTNMRLHVIIADVTLSKPLICRCWMLLEISERKLTAILKPSCLLCNSVVSHKIVAYKSPWKIPALCRYTQRGKRRPIIFLYYLLLGCHTANHWPTIGHWFSWSDVCFVFVWNIINQIWIMVVN